MEQEFDPIAIVGMAVRLPGGVKNTADFWNLMVNRKSGLIPVPKERWDIDGFWNKTAQWGTIQNRECYMLGSECPLDRYDTAFFTNGRLEASRMDPVQRQLLEITRECLDTAGASATRETDVGCYVGTFSSDWQDDQSMDPHASGIYRGSGYLDFFQPNRISYEYAWTGPSMLIKTGCSSSMVALHLAAEAVRTGSCSSAMALGCNLMTSVMTNVVFTETGVLSPSGKCKTFDAMADGYGRGEAVNAVYIKKLSHAIRDGNPVRAILRASGTNNDGRSQGIMTPSDVMQERLIRQVYEKAGIADVSKTAFFECHGTGTPTGDPLETSAVARIWGPHGGISMGSVKPNVGHSEGAAGLTSVIKAVLALEHKTIPPNIYLDNPSPRIPWEAAHLRVPTEPEPWPADRDKRVSVNSFGVAGSNCHCIIEAYTQSRRSGSTDSGVLLAHDRDELPRLLLFSASHVDSLGKQVDQHKAYLADNTGQLDDMAYTLAFRREPLGCRNYAIANAEGMWEASSPQSPPNIHRRLVYVYTGQGAHWAGMGRTLVLANHEFRASIQRCDRFLQSLPEPPSWSLEEELLNSDAGSSKVGKRGYSHPCATAVQIALTDLLASMGVRPEAVTAHSGGEAAAAYATGSITDEQAMAVAYFRSLCIMGDGVPLGTMAAVALGAKALAPFLIPGVVIGCENSQNSCTLSGNPLSVQHCVDQIGRRHPDVKYKMLDLETSFHSPWLEPLTGPYREAMRPYFAQGTKAPACPHFSSVTGREMFGEAADFGLEYWVDNFLLPVRFNTAVRTVLASDPNNVFVEIGPHPVLKAPVTDILRSVSRPAAAACAYMPTLVRQQDSHLSLLHLVGGLFALKVAVDLADVVPEGRVLPDLPMYPWMHNAVNMYVPRNAARFKQRQYPRHALLGARVLEGNDIEPAWRCMLDLKESAWLFDHIVNGAILFPATAYVAMVGEAMRQVAGGQLPYTIRNMAFTTGLVLPKDTRREMYTRLIPTTESPSTSEEEPGVWYDFRIMSSDGLHWTSHCHGSVRAGADVDLRAEGLLALGRDKTERALPRSVDSDSWYEAAAKVGIEWQRAFQGLDDVTTGTVAREASATVLEYRDTTVYAAHPTLLDQLLQINLVALTKGLLRNIDSLIQLPTQIERLAVFSEHDGESDLPMRLFGEVDGEASLAADRTCCRSVMLSEHDRPRAILQGLLFSELPSTKAKSRKDAQLGSYFEWDTDLTLVPDLKGELALAKTEQPFCDDGSSQTKHHVKEELRRFVSLLGWKYPDARVLEIGQGDVDVTKVALEALHPEPRRRYYETYTYACSTSEALEVVVAAIANGEGKGKGGSHDVAVVSVEDLSLVDPVELVVMDFSTLLQDDDLLQLELEELDSLTCPWGWLLIHNNLVPMVDEERDQAIERLEELGFCVKQVTSTGLILAQLPAPVVKQTVTILTPNSALGTTLGAQVRECLQRRDGEVSVIVSHDTCLPMDAKSNETVIYLHDIEAATMHDLDADTFRPLMDSLCQFRGSLIWATPALRASCKDPRPAMAQGVVRTLHMEYGLDATIVEVGNDALPSPATTSNSNSNNNSSTPTLAHTLARVCGTLASRRTGRALDPDHDYAVIERGVQIPRMQWFGLDQAGGVGGDTMGMFRDDVTYLLVGGAGGLGRSVAVWMAENGARSFLFLSRSAGDAKNQPFRRELESFPGCHVEAVSADVSDLAAVQRVLALAPVDKPVAGVMQLALVLCDNGTKQMTFGEWETVVKPRVDGTWNLHKATSELQLALDFFVVFGSGGGITGYFGQANYSASNTYLDALVEHRHFLGLPASIIDIGVLGDVGYLTSQQKHFEAFLNAGYLFLAEQDVLDATAVAVRHSHDRGPLHSFCLGAVAELPFNNPGNRLNWKRDVRFGVAHHHAAGSGGRSKSGGGRPTGSPSTWRKGLEGEGEGEGEGALSADHDDGFNLDNHVKLARADAHDPRLRDASVMASLARSLCSALAEILLQPEDSFNVQTRLISIGLDSIVAIELVDWIREQLQVTTTAIEVTQCSSLLHLAGNLNEIIIQNASG